MIDRQGGRKSHASGGIVSSYFAGLSGGLAVSANRANGISQSLWISIAVAAGVVVFCVFHQEIYLALMFGYLAYTNYNLLQHFSGGGGFGGGRPW